MIIREEKKILLRLSMSRFFLLKCLLLLIAATIAASCSENSVKNVQPSLISFEISKANNKDIDKTITFEYDENQACYRGFYLKWIDKDNPDLFIPSFNYVGDRFTINGADVVSGETSLSFTGDLLCTVYSGNDKRDYKVSLVCPQINNELPVLRIDLNASDIKEEYTWLESKLMLYDAANNDMRWNYTDEAVNIRGRGNSTWVLPKKPYRIKFPKKISPLKDITTQAKNWSLLAHDMDKSLIRNHLGFCIARELFANNFVPVSDYVNVYFKDDYHGLYQLTDHIERGEGRVEIEKLDVKTGDGPDVITGGYMLESVINIDDPAIHFTTTKGFGFDHKYPKDDDHLDSQYKWIEDYVQQAEDVLFSDAFDDPNNGWRHYFDENTLVDYIITKELSGDMDGYISTRLYKKRGDDKLYLGPVWDMDKGWGNDNRTPHVDYPPNNSLMIFAGFRMNGTSGTDWFCRFWEDKSLRDAVSLRWKQMKEILFTRVEAEIDRCQNEMAKSIQANFEVWPFNYQKSEFAPVPSGDYASLLDEMRQMTKERVTLLDNILK